MASVLLACAEPRTELVVVIHSEIEELDEVVVDIGLADRVARLQTETVDVDGIESFPLTFGLTSRSHSDTLIDLEVRGRRGGVEIVQVHTRTRFVPRESRVLVIVLERACANQPRCPDERMTCRGGECVDLYVPPSELPPRRDVLPDAGVRPHRDGGPGMDAGDGAIEGGPGDGGDAGSEGGCTGDAGLEGMPPGCVLDRWPARPTCGDSGDDGIVRLVAVLDPSMDTASRDTGYDLDGLCTEPGDDGLMECEAAEGRIIADGRNGVDNSAGDTLAIGLDFVFPGYEAAMRDTMREGRNVPVLHISGWSGQPDDGTVAIWLAGTADVTRSEDRAADGGVFDPDAPREDPRWDGTDVAYLSSSYFSALGEPRIGDDQAYVAGGVLVARLPDRAEIDLPVPGRGVGRLRFTDTHIVAPLTADGRSFTSGIVVGRWSQADMFAYTDDLGICMSDPRVALFFPTFRTAVERALDVRSDPDTGGLPGVACNAVSTTFAFETGVPVALGGIVDFPVEPAGCP